MEIDKTFQISFILFNMNLEGFSYNLQQTESKSAHSNRRYSLPKERNVITLDL